MDVLDDGDLDPGAGVPFRRVVEVAAWVRDELDAMGLAAAVKTSGSRGINDARTRPSRSASSQSAGRIQSSPAVAE